MKEIKWIGKSIPGVRKPGNEDSLTIFSCGAEGAKQEELVGTGEIAERDLVFAVADGMGGAKAGDVASSLLLKEMQRVIPESFKMAASGIYPDPINHLEEAIHRANTALNHFSEQNPETKGMGATLALSWFSEENMYFANIGDSRVYRYHRGQLIQLTVDHTYCWAAMARGELTEREFRNHPRRSLLYEVMGGSHHTVSPQLGACPYEAGDRFLICSDGVIDGLWDKHISAEMEENESLETACERMLEKALEMDGSDDTTLIVLEIS